MFYNVNNSYPLYGIGTKLSEFRLGLFYLHKNLELVRKKLHFYSNIQKLANVLNVKIDNLGHSLPNLEKIFAAFDHPPQFSFVEETTTQLEKVDGELNLNNDFV